MVPLTGTNYCHMQQLHLIGFLMNIPKNHHTSLYFVCHPYLPHLPAFLPPKLRYLGMDEGMIHLDKLRQAYMLAALNMKEAYSKQFEQYIAPVYSSQSS